MENFLYNYWAYVASIALIAFFFKFNRVFSVRNLDLLGLVALAPGMLLVAYGQRLRAAEQIAEQASHSLAEQAGYFVLFGVGVFFLVRLLLDLAMSRRPLLDPNLSPGGLSFVTLALFGFLMLSVITAPAPELPEQAVSERPGFPVLDSFTSIASHIFAGSPSRGTVHAAATRVLAILAHLAVVAGLIYIGYRQFDNLWTGLAMATLYLLLPYTASSMGQLAHVVPAALLVWVVACFRRPLAAGLLLGLAAGLIYYPLFLLPLWGSFYARRGLVRFLVGMVVSLAGLAVLVAVMDRQSLGTFLGHFTGMFHLSIPGASGLWAVWHPYMRLPLSVLFACLCVGMVIWPAQKNLGTLMSCSAIVMLGTQFWYPYGGLLYMNWYLPLLVLTIYRPNLEHRVAVTSLGKSWFERRREVAQQAA